MTSLNEFVEFNAFVYQTTGSYLKFANSFENLFIYIPRDEKLPTWEQPSSSLCKISIKNYFANCNNDFRRLVYNNHWNSLEGHLGYDILRFCFTKCIIAKRTKTGCFIVSSLKNFCNKIKPEIRQKLNKIFYNTATCCQEKCVVIENEALQRNKDDQQNLNHLFCLNDLEISTDDLLFKISRNRKFADNHILVTTNPKASLSSHVINTRVGNFKINEYEECVETLDTMLEKLKKLHNKYNYERSLSHLISSHSAKCGHEKTENEIQKNPLHLSVLKMYFTNICSSVIPKELFGSHKNRNTFVKIICDLLESARGQSVSLKPHILKMRISEMHWLDRVTNTDTRWSVLGKLLKWILKKLILDIFRAQLYIMVTNSSEKIYFSQKNWQKLTNEFVQTMSKEKVIARTNGLEIKPACDGRWLLLPKKNGLRPIMARIRSNKEKGIMKIALRYLQQLYITKYNKLGKPSFLEQWRSLVSNVRNSENRPFYFVSCDIQDAFGSIDQRKLIKIVESLAKLTGPHISVRNYKFARNLRAVRSESCEMRIYVTYPELELPVGANTIIATEGERVAQIRKEKLLKAINQSILTQNILVSNQRYLLQKGIPQGATLSSVLCDIYYADMEATSLSQFKQEGFLHRYVDDILFVTANKAVAERFLLHVKNGFPDYNCSFNAAKTRTNLVKNDNSSKQTTYLGFTISFDNLEVCSNYSKSPRYTTTLSKPRSNEILKTFRNRLSNLASLKVDGLILDCIINSEETVIHNIKSVFTRQAGRCLWLLKALFDDISHQPNKIFRIIRLTNLRIIRRIQIYFLANKYDFEKLVPRLAVIPWKCYREVFAKAPKIHTHFRSLFFESLKMSELAAAAITKSSRNKVAARYASQEFISSETIIDTSLF